MNSHRRLTAICLLHLATCLVSGHAWSSVQSPDRPFAYVVCDDGYFRDHRVYRIDMLAGELAGTSEPIDWMGSPLKIAYDPNLFRIYAASQRGKTWDYWPVTVLRVGGGEFEVLAHYSTNPEDTQPRGSERTVLDEDGQTRTTHLNTLPDEVYEFTVSPDGRELYLSHGGLVETEHVTEVWDARTGQVLRRLIQITPDARAWSPDGSLVAGFWAADEQETVEPGLVTIYRNQGGVSLRDAKSLEVLSVNYVEDNRGLQPPWGRIERPFIYRHRSAGETRVYDRDSGEVLRTLDLNELVKIPGASLVHLNGVWSEVNSLPVLENPAWVPLSVTAQFHESSTPNSYSGHQQGYVVLIDILETREATPIKVGVKCSNAVVAYE